MSSGGNSSSAGTAASGAASGGFSSGTGGTAAAAGQRSQAGACSSSCESAAGTTGRDSAGAGGDSSGGDSTAAGQAGTGTGDSVPSDWLLHKLVEPSSQYESLVGYLELPDAPAKLTELGAEGYAITTAMWDLGSVPYTMRYVAVKAIASTAKYDSLVGYLELPDAPATLTELGAEGYVITTAMWDLGSVPYTMRYVAVRATASAAKYASLVGYLELPDAPAKLTELGAEGYVITTAMWNLGSVPYSMRYVAVKASDSAAKYDALVGYLELPDASAKTTELGAEGYVITSATWYQNTTPYSMRYVAVKATGSAATYGALVDYMQLPDAQTKVTELGGEGSMITTAMWYLNTTPYSMRYFAINH